jgi:hypothetical protein
VIGSREAEVVSAEQVEMGRGGRGTSAERRDNAQGTTRVAAYAGAGTPLAGVLSRVFLEQVSGGQPLLLRGGQPLLLRGGRHGRVVAVLLDPDSSAELEASAEELLAEAPPR